ncbi:hypothetical protein [Glutamicibacter endophyticus]|uniref:hypothetical protein n=1 Tax=Glutamicibacter endophyticus TaxID=1522174 RepID=UPI003AF14071
MTDQELGAGKTCFVVTPIGDALAPLGTDGRMAYERALEMWSKVFSPACEQFGLQVVRADKIADPGELPDQIFTYLRDAEIVVADVSGGNPNVMYELGLRHSKHAITLQVGEYGRLPFDVQSIRTIQFTRNEMGLIEARNALTEALRVALTTGPTKLRATDVFTDGDGGKVDPAADAARSLDTEDGQTVLDEPGLLEVMAAGETAISHVSEVLNNAQECIVEISEVTKFAAERAQSPQVTSKGFTGRLLVMRDLAKELDPLAKSLDAAGEAFATDIDLMDAMIKNVLARAGEEDSSEVEVFLGQLDGLLDASEEGAEGIIGMRTSVKNNRDLSRDIRPVMDSIVRSLDRFIASIQVMLSWRDGIDEARQLLRARAN